MAHFHAVMTCCHRRAGDSRASRSIDIHKRLLCGAAPYRASTEHAKAEIRSKGANVRLDPDPVPFDIQTRAATLITERMKSAATPEDLRRRAEKISPTLIVQRFTIADGSTRYFLWADWRSAQGPGYESTVRLAAWLAPSPSLHFLAVEPPGAGDGVQKENLLNVVDLGSGRTGIVVYIQGADSRGIQLMEYKDGADLEHMRVIQSVGVAE